MRPTVLRLKSGQSLYCVPPDEGVLQELAACVQTPARAPVQFQVAQPDGAVVTVSAADVAAVELAPPYCVIRNFLPEEELGRILAHALAHESAFEDATVSVSAKHGESQPDYRFRRSRILNEVADIMPILQPRLEAATMQVWPRLHLPQINFHRVECQLAVHGDGGFFATHTDNGLPDIAHRRISYVYYFHREPKQFSGGLLRFYGSLIQDGTRGQLFAEIEPPRNGLIIFPSYCHHEVTPVHSAATAMADLRLTANGWFCV